MMMKEYMICHIAGSMLGVCLDLIIGDPHNLPHPVRAMGRLISFLEGRLLGSGSCRSGDEDTADSLRADQCKERTAVREKGGERDAGREKRRGAVLWFAVMLCVILVTFSILRILVLPGRYVLTAVYAVLGCYALAARSLQRESMAVGLRLEKGDIEGARHALSMIVGRDTVNLDAEDIIKAAVETVAENTSDGVIAPLFYLFALGPIAAMAYKAVNTMDSMLGYRNERYMYFGTFSAVADDVFNYIPSRISALCMIAGCRILELVSKDYNAAKAYRIWKRDASNHLSPNSGQTESACAGALGLKLGGTHRYQGVIVEKPCIGDETRKPVTADIGRANALMFISEGCFIFFALLVWALILLMI